MHSAGEIASLIVPDFKEVPVATIEAVIAEYKKVKIWASDPLLRPEGTAPIFGAIGALAIGAGAEITTVLATGTLWTEVPESVRVELQGALRPGAHPRDIGFLLSKGFSQGTWNVDHDNRVIEFDGAGLADFDLASRVALCNTLTEIGVANVLFASPPPGIDVATVPDFISDANAAFAGRIDLDLARIEPQVALPGAPAVTSGLASKTRCSTSI
jgi:homoaconitase/3-isopropylmalate dehydratase large subunit